MKIKCLICGTEFERYGKQAKIAKTCSFKCMGLLNTAKPNTKCTNCSKEFHLKESAKKRYKRSMGFFCSISCTNIYKKKFFSEEGNHQFGLKGDLNSSFKGDLTYKRNHTNIDIYKYVGFKYPKNKHGRVLIHRFLVQENYHLFNKDYFDVIDGKHIIKEGLDVHHKDNNHSNNDLSNLQVLSRSVHTSIHNSQKEIIRNRKGQIVTTKPNHKP